MGCVMLFSLLKQNFVWYNFVNRLNTKSQSPLANMGKYNSKPIGTEKKPLPRILQTKEGAKWNLY